VLICLVCILNIATVCSGVNVRSLSYNVSCMSEHVYGYLCCMWEGLKAARVGITGGGGLRDVQPPVHVYSGQLLLIQLSPGW